MRKRLVLYLWGKVALSFAVCMLIPLVMTLFINENRIAEFGVPVLISFTLGKYLTKGENPYKGRLSLREGIVLVGWGFIFVCILGMLPYLIAGYSFINSFFESVSGFTTTGASVIGDISLVPRELLLWRSLSQWFGGLSIIVIFITLVPQVGKDALQLFTAELHGESAERVLPRISKVIKLLTLTYVGCTFLVAIIFYVLGMNYFDAYNHAMTVISTGGFSTHNGGLNYFNSWSINVVAMVCMFLAGMNHVLFYRAYKDGLKNILKNTEWRYYVGLIVVFTLLMGADLYYQGIYTKPEGMFNALFMTISIISTTGFSSVEYNSWTDFCKFCLLLLMLIGGCSGSSAGGIKISRLVIMLKISWEELKRTIHPHMVTSITMSGHSVSHKVVDGISKFFYIYILVFFIAASLISLTADITMFSAAGVSASCLASVGKGFETLAESQSFGELSSIAKFVLTFTMIIGRLEIFSLCVLFHPEFWKSNRMG